MIGSATIYPFHVLRYVFSCPFFSQQHFCRLKIPLCLFHALAGGKFVPAAGKFVPPAVCCLGGDQ